MLQMGQLFLTRSLRCVHLGQVMDVIQGSEDDVGQDAVSVGDKVNLAPACV